MRAEGRALSRMVALALAMLAAACTHLNTAAHTAGPQLRVMTYNIRLDLPSDGPNAWPNRRGLVAALIAHEAPDILGMQEVLVGQKRDLELALPDYAMVGVARNDGREAGEFSPLAFRRERFEILKSGTFWLSPDPETPGKGWDAALPRIATWAILRDRSTGKKLRAINTHFDHQGQEARRQSAAMIARWVAEGPDREVPTVVLGDFNADPESEPYRRLSSDAAAGLVDARLASQTAPYGPPGTFTGFEIAKAARLPIDHIFVGRAFAVNRYAVITQHWGGRLPSDHYPVIADLTLRLN